MTENSIPWSLAMNSLTGRLQNGHYMHRPKHERQVMLALKGFTTSIGNFHDALLILSQAASLA